MKKAFIWFLAGGIAAALSFLLFLLLHWPAPVNQPSAGLFHLSGLGREEHFAWMLLWGGLYGVLFYLLFRHFLPKSLPGAALDLALLLFLASALLFPLLEGRSFSASLPTLLHSAAWNLAFCFCLFFLAKQME